jgi:hypothetical protein
MEAALLAVSRMEAFSMLRISQKYVTKGNRHGREENRLADRKRVQLYARHPEHRKGDAGSSAEHSSKGASVNRATRTNVATIGVMLGIAGLDHGFFEVLQGNKPTGGLFIQAIAPARQWWAYGGEEAFTIVPNFLATGILAILISLAVMVWSVGFAHRKRGPLVLALLLISLFLVGGGIAQILFFAPLLFAATRIHKPLAGWHRVLSGPVGRLLSGLWPGALAVTAVSFTIGLVIAIWGFVPGVHDPEQVLEICWAFVFGGGLGGLLVSTVAGLARDLESRRQRDARYIGREAVLLVGEG